MDKMDKKIKIGQVGGARKAAAEFTKVRKAPFSTEIFRILEDYAKNNKKPEKKSAKPSGDVGI